MSSFHKPGGHAPVGHEPVGHTPTGAVNAGTDIANTNAVYHPSSYVVCQRTGFKLERDEILDEWNGALVRPESWERRSSQDFVRLRADKTRGSIRPEKTDTFIAAYPNGVNASDL
jgi:hypothetical protein